jgi:outer membrane lipoprotein-sorting protein
LILVALLSMGADGPAAGSEAARRGWESAPPGADGHEIATRAEDQLRADGTYMRAEMTVVSPRLAAPRVVSFEDWDDRGGKRAFIHIVKPAKDRDTTFLKLTPNLWMYVPRVERTMRIPPSMMLQSWMGSDFTNDDLVKDSSEVEDYDHSMLGVDPAPEGHPGRTAYVVQYTPHEDAPVVWGRILGWIDTQHYAPLRQEFYDERGVKLRVMRFSDHRSQSGRHFPHQWVMLPLDKEGHSTTIRIEEVKFNPEVDAGVFTKRNLTRRR